MVDYSLIADREAQDVVDAAKSAATTMPIFKSISSIRSLEAGQNRLAGVKSTFTLETWYCGLSSNVIVIK